MAYGLKIWDAAGNVTLDTTDRITRYHTTVSLGSIPASSTVSINVPGITTDGTWFLVLSGALNFIYMYITTNYLNFNNTQAYAQDLTGTTIEVFRG